MVPMHPLNKRESCMQRAPANLAALSWPTCVALFAHLRRPLCPLASRACTRSAAQQRSDKRSALAALQHEAEAAAAERQAATDKELRAKEAELAQCREQLRKAQATAETRTRASLMGRRVRADCVCIARGGTGERCWLASPLASRRVVGRQRKASRAQLCCGARVQGAGVSGICCFGLAFAEVIAAARLESKSLFS
eukprot:6205735-Pleurochrysis_carterae.AAC.3